MSKRKRCSETSLGRPPDKRDEVVGHLRRAMVSGKLKPGERLPTHEMLEQRFRAASTSIRAAMGVLQREGFIETRHRLGTFVVARPPHLHNIVVALPERFAPARHWSNYYVAMTRAAAMLSRELGRPIRIMEGLEDHAGKTHIELNHLARTHQVAGIVFVYPPVLYKGTAMLEEPGIPRVAVSASRDQFPQINTTIRLNVGFMERALECLTQQGRRNIAVLTSIMPGCKEYEEIIRAPLVASGVFCPPHWQIPVGIQTPDTACAVMRLLMHGRAPADRPDGLIISDDNLVESALAGLVAEQVTVPADMAVVAHCNFPWPAVTTLPIRRLGPDIAQMLRECIAAIDALRAGLPATGLIRIPAVWEEECGGGGILQD